MPRTALMAALLAGLAATASHAQNDGRFDTNEYYGDPDEGHFGDPASGYHGRPVIDRSDQVRTYRPAKPSESPYLTVDPAEVEELDRSFQGG